VILTIETGFFMKTFFLFFVLSISYLFLSCSYINNTEEQPFGYAWQSAFPAALAMSSLVLGNEVNSASAKGFTAL
jgi:hypothetical protein